MSKISIGFFLSSFGIGGAERQYSYLLDHIDRHKFNVFLIQISHKKNRPSITKDTTRARAVIKTFEMRHKFDFSVIFRISRYIRKNKIDLIQSLLFLDNQIAKITGILSRKPVIASVRGGPHEGIIRTWIDHHFVWLSNKIIVNSKWLKHTLVAAKVHPKKVKVIYNGINPAKFRCDKDPIEIKKLFGINANKKLLTIVARLHPMKQHTMFFDVAKLVIERGHDVLALVAGDGELRSELENYVYKIGIRNNVIFLGDVTANLPELLRITDVLLLTSGWGESLPNTLLESLAAGVPLVSTNIHGIPEIIDDGVNGFTVASGDCDTMASRVEDLLINSELKRRFIAEGYKKVAQLSVDKMVRSYEKLYQDEIQL